MTRPIEWYGLSEGIQAITSGADVSLAADAFEVPYRMHITSTAYLSRYSVKAAPGTTLSTRNVIHGTSVTNTDATFGPNFTDTQAQGDITIMFYKDGAAYEVPWVVVGTTRVRAGEFPSLTNLYIDTLDSGGSTIASVAYSTLTRQQVAGSKFTTVTEETLYGNMYGFKLWHANPGTDWRTTDHNPVGFYLRYMVLPGDRPTELRQRQSPVRTPSRLRGLPSRIRQTPTVIK